MLFLGGQENGRRMDVHVMDRHLFFPAKQRAIYARLDDAAIPLISSQFDTVVYERVHVKVFENQDVDIFFPQGWAPHWQMKALRDYLEFG